MRTIVKAATAIPEMQFAFECICADDKKEPENYTDEEIVSEAEYRLSTYFEDGHINSDEMRMGDDPEMNKIARKDIRMLKAFIKKYKTTDSQWSKYISHLIK
jgi:hypothetical protein